MNPEGEIVPYLAAGALIMYIQKWLKGFRWYQRFVTAFPTADKHVHRMVAGLGALIAAVGIHFTFQGDASSGWQLHVNIPNANQLLHGGWDFANVYIFQQLSYDVTRKPAVMPHDTPTGGT